MSLNYLALFQFKRPPYENALHSFEFFCVPEELKLRDFSFLSEKLKNCVVA